MSLPIRLGALLVLACTLAFPVLAAPAAGDDDGRAVQTDLDAVDRAHAAYLKKGRIQAERPDPETPETAPGGADATLPADQAGHRPAGPQGGDDLQLRRSEAGNQPRIPGGDLQLERPESDEIDIPRKQNPPPKWLQAIFDFLGRLGPLLQFVFWAALVVAGLGILYFLFGEAIRVRFGKSGDGKVDNPDDVLTDVRPDAAQALSLLEEADALARTGKFAEAVHLLLFRSIDDIQQRLEGGVPRSLTAREIGGLRHLPERASRALKPIITIVEHSFFGGRDVDEAGWKTARGSYEKFAFGEGWE